MTLSNEKKIETEQLFINLLLNHKDLVGDWINSGLKPNYFENNHKFILFAIEEAFRKNALLTREAYYSFAKSHVKNNVELNVQSFLYDKISILDSERDNFDLYKEQIVDRYISENSVSYVEEFRKEMEAKGSSVALKKFAKKISDLASDSSATKIATIYESVATYAPQFFNVLSEKRKGNIKVEVITCGIKEIDKTMVVGFAPGTLTLICAETSNYKSTMMLNIGINIWKRGHSVLFVPLEMPRDKMYEKFLSNITAIPFEKIEHPTTLSEEELKKIEDMTKKLQEPSEAHFFIMDTYERIPVSVIRREIEKHIDIFKPRVVIIDYTANLTGEANSEKRRSDELIGDALKDLRTMGRPGAVHDEGFAIVTAAQIGREALKRIRRTGSNKLAFFSEDIRGSHDYSADSDFIYAQMVDESQPNERLMLFPMKCRYSKKTFGKNENRAMLELKPEIGLIRSIEDEWMAHSKDNIMKKIDDKSIDVKEEELSFEKETNTETKSSSSKEFDDIIVGDDDDDDNFSVDDIAGAI